MSSSSGPLEQNRRNWILIVVPLVFELAKNELGFPGG